MPLAPDRNAVAPAGRRGLDGGMTAELRTPPKARPGDRVAVLSPSFAAPGHAPEVHEQAMRRLADLTGLVPVEYATTRQLGASAQDRARDLNAAFADPEIRAVLATVGGEDQITVVPHLDPRSVRADPKPYLGYSDNTNILNWLWTQGVAGFYGGSTQVQLGPGPAVDPVHVAALRAALLTGERLEVTEPGESEDFGKDWLDPAALTSYGEREPVEPWTWAGPARTVTGRTWGGCLEVLQWILTAGRFPVDPAVVAGGVLLVETSEDLLPAPEFGQILRSLGERGVLAAVDAVLVARPATSNFEDRPSAEARAARRAAQRDVAIATVARYHPEAVVVVGVPFGHTRPQWILPYGGRVSVDGRSRRVWADYS
jgi:muramoyltetrapeptide carboxypeptidase LdcA involved in peptidoglycan recycling